MISVDVESIFGVADIIGYKPSLILELDQPHLQSVALFLFLLLLFLVLHDLVLANYMFLVKVYNQLVLSFDNCSVVFNHLGCILHLQLSVSSQLSFEVNKACNFLRNSGDFAILY